ncbi:hypothetical protein SBX64_16880 [Vibrio rhizosphaerae]|uniref:Uncharacterized protein n=1 Tax=Vibrio rhizosphaerae TaxID=398736 RepID=A0ABU4IXT3_9VIBR|nr:hypothetical protein [Vibrio rhizosphaerae]MDW6094215.1 hypothetical protein [Vibrio rhizosphaerae]
MKNNLHLVCVRYDGKNPENRREMQAKKFQSAGSETGSKRLTEREKNRFRLRIILVAGWHDFREEVT